MNPREKKMVVAIVALLGLGVTYKFIYPQWLKPVLSFDARIDKLKETKDSFEPKFAQLQTSFEKYQEYVARSGGIEVGEVSQEFGRTLNDLLLTSKLSDLRTNPKEPVVDKRTGLSTISYSFSAEGRLQDTVTFLRGFYELPYLTRFKDVKLTPNKGRGGARSDSVKISGSIDLWVPAKPDTPVPLDPNRQAPSIRRHRGEMYARIWEKDFFNKPEIQVADVPPDDPEPQPCTCPDGTPCPASDPASCPQPKPAPVTAERDPQGAQKVVKMCVQSPAEEVVVVNTASKQREFVAKGQPIDGGTLLMVHPYGALVRRMDAGHDRDFLYPIGESLADSIRIDQAQRFPELRTFARQYLKEERERKKAEEAAAAAAEAAAREAAESARLAEQQTFLGEFVGPPPELAGAAADFFMPQQPGMMDEIVGPPDWLAADAIMGIVPGIDDGTPLVHPFSEQVGPPAELAGPPQAAQPNETKLKVPPRTRKVPARRSRTPGNRGS